MKRMSSLAYHFGVKLRFYPSSKQKKIIKLNYDAQRFVYNSYVGRNRTSYHAKRYLANRQNRAMPFAFSALNSYEVQLAETLEQLSQDWSWNSDFSQKTQRLVISDQLSIS